MKCALLLALAMGVRGQVFEVASLKPSGPALANGNYNANLGTIRHGEVILENATLADCVKFAWGLAADEQVDGESWIKSKAVRFDILGKASPSTPREESLLMLRALLVERFHLATHTEKRRVSHLALTVDKNGPKMREVERDPATAHMTYRIGAITHNQISMGTLAMLLSRQLRQPVIDETGLKGVYEMQLLWTPEGSDADAGPSVYTAVKEQLGLRLENRRDGMEVLVVDHADRVPVGN